MCAFGTRKGVHLPQLSKPPCVEGVMPQARSRRTRLGIAAALAAAVALLPASEALASSTQSSNFDGARWALDNPVEATTEISNLGADYLRIVMIWRNVVPNGESRQRPDFDATDPDAYSGEWNEYKRLVSEARSKGLRIILTPSGPAPSWATSNGDGKTNPSVTEFERFVTAVGKEFGSDVAFWSFWNEPNQEAFLMPQRRNGKAYSPTLYRNLFLAGQRALRTAGVRNPKLLLGETAPRGGPQVRPLQFLRALLCLDNRYRPVRGKGCQKLNVAGYAHHPYSGRRGPYEKPVSGDDVTMGVLTRLNHALDRAARANRLPRNLGIYLTEYGVQSYPDRFLGVPLPRQAEYLALSERMSYGNPRVRTYSQFLMRDDAPRAGTGIRRYSGFETGLETSNGRKKPSYEGWRLPLSVQRNGNRVSIWGLVRPAKRRTTVTIEYRDGSRGRFRKLRTLRTNSRGYYTMSGGRKTGRRWRAVWRSPDGKTFTGPAIGELPRP
jgi:hypothetical protein